MQTPFEILQLKQQRRKNIISQSQKQRNRVVSVKFQKRQNNNCTQCTINKDQQPNIAELSEIINSEPKAYSQKAHSENRKDLIQGTKYEIIFRESIRKNNQHRNKTYHNHHSSLKTTANLSSEGIDNNPEAKAISFSGGKSSGSQSPVFRHNKRFGHSNTEIIKVGKYKIVLNSTKGSGSKSLVRHTVVPEFTTNESFLQEQRQKGKNSERKVLEKAIQKFCVENSSNLTVGDEKRVSTAAVSSISADKKYFRKSSLEKRKYDLTRLHQQHMDNCQKKQNCCVSISKEQSKSLNRIRFKGKPVVELNTGKTNIFEQVKEYEDHSALCDALDDQNVANFIKSKKKKRLLASSSNNRDTVHVPTNTVKNQQSEAASSRQMYSTLGAGKWRIPKYQDYHREVANTDLNNVRRLVSTGNTKKKFQTVPATPSGRSPAKIKINSLEDNLSGWDYQPCHYDF